MAMNINLTGPLPAPYKILYGLENTTQELKVGASANSSRARSEMNEASQMVLVIPSPCLDLPKPEKQMQERNT